MKAITQLDIWHRSRSGLLTIGLIELIVAYGFASIAIDRGTWWWYFLTLLFLIGAIQNMLHLIGTFIHGRH
jgi:hypothetical protein